MIAKRARRITGAITAKMQPTIGPKALQKQIEARRDVRVVNEREMNQKLRDITFCNNLVACQPTETI